MRSGRWGWLAVALAVVVGAFASARWSLLGQDRAARGQARAKGEPAGVRAAGPAVSVQDALLKPIDLPFDRETTLEEVRQYLGKALGAPVVLDRSALDRLDLTPEETVQIDLKGVRLKVGLKLLLDQVGMGFKVVPEDNLLILTDPEGSDDSDQRVLAEVKALHREIHDLQDAVDDLRDLVEEDLGVEPDPPQRRSTLVGSRPSTPSHRGSRPASTPRARRARP